MLTLLDRSITSYDSASSFLKDYFLQKKKKNSKFSIRSWSSKMGLKSHGALQQIINGKRHLPKRYLPQVASSLNLSDDELKYLDALLDYEKSKTQSEKSYFLKKLEKLKPIVFEDRFRQINSYQFFKNPLHSILLSLMRREGFKLDIDKIKNTLCFKVTDYELQDVIQRLVDLKLIAINGEKVIVADYHIRNKIDIPSKAVQRFHQKMSLIARDQVVKQSVESREYNSVSFNIKKSSIKEAKKRIRNFMNEFLEDFSTTDEKSVLYHINMQLFGLTKDLHTGAVNEENTIH